MSDFDLPQTTTRKSIPTPKVRPSIKPEEIPAEISKEEVKDENKEKPQYSQEELLAVFDEILFSNEYTEDFTVRNRLKVTFRTRTAKEIQDINKHLDSMGASLVSTVEGVRAMMNLESALVHYQGKDLGAMKQADRSAFIAQLPGPIIGALMITLGKFDHKVALACQEGEANF